MNKLNENTKYVMLCGVTLARTPSLSSYKHINYKGFGNNSRKGFCLLLRLNRGQDFGGGYADMT